MAMISSFDTLLEKEFQLITGAYRYDKTIRLWCRNNFDEKVVIDIWGFEPYMYVPEQAEVPCNDGQYVKPVVAVEEADFKDPWGRKFKKVYVEKPTDVKDIRGNWSMTCEADIKFVQRLMIDLGIYAGFKIEKNEHDVFKSSDNVWQVHYTTLKSTNYTHPALELAMDIEMYTEGTLPTPEDPKYPLISITLYDNYRKNYITFFLSGKNKDVYWKTDNWLVKECDTEENMYKEVYALINRINPDVPHGWNMDFDWDNLLARGEEIGIKFYHKGMMPTDMISFFRKIKGKTYSNKLKEVAVEEGLATKEEMVANEFDIEMYKDKERWPSFLQYNYDDVKYEQGINEKYGVVPFHWEIKNFAGLYSVRETQWNTHIIDTILLRISLSEFGYVLPTVAETTGESYKGATNIRPVPGFYEGVCIFDFSRFFPSTIIMFNFSPEYTHLSEEERIKKPLGLAGRLCQILGQNRDKQDALLEEIRKNIGPHSIEYRIQKRRRDSSKFLLNAVYGYFAFYKCRLNDRKGMEQMVAKAMEGLNFLAECSMEAGHKVLHAHTDSSTVKVEKDNIEFLNSYLNRRMEEYAVEHKVQPLWKINAETWGDIIFVRSKDKKKGGAVTRYAMRVYWKDGDDVPEPYTIIKGFDTIRMDQSPITKNVQKECIESIFDGTFDKFTSKVRKMIKDIRKGKYSYEQLAVSVGLGKELKDYGGKNEKGDEKAKPDFVMACEWAQAELGMEFRAGDRIKKLYVKHVPGKSPTKLVPFFNREQVPKNVVVDYDKIINLTIKGKVETLFESMGTNWKKEIEGQTDLASFFG